MDFEVCETVCFLGKSSDFVWVFVDFLVFLKMPQKAEMHRLVAVHLRKVNSMFIILAQSCLNVNSIFLFLGRSMPYMVVVIQLNKLY